MTAGLCRAGRFSLVAGLVVGVACTPGGRPDSRLTAPPTASADREVATCEPATPTVASAARIARTGRTLGAPFVANLGVFEPAVSPCPLPLVLEPRALLEWLACCVSHHDAFVQDYTCMMSIEEPRTGEPAAVQQVAVRFRQRPFSVDLSWQANRRGADRVCYVVGRWPDGRGLERALVEPAGLTGVLVPRTMLPITGRLLGEAARYPIDEFGFGHTLRRLVHFGELAQDEPGYALEYCGPAMVDGRPCYVLRRILPDTEPGLVYPNRVVVVYIDQQWLVPTACVEFADLEAMQLIGAYILTNVRFNVGLTDDDFAP